MASIFGYSRRLQLFDKSPYFSLRQRIFQPENVDARRNFEISERDYILYL